MSSTAGTTTPSVPRASQADWDIKIRELRVVGREAITPRMLRVTLGGPDVGGFESHLPDEHVKLVFPDPDTGVVTPPTQDGSRLHWPTPFPPTRDYTIRRFRPTEGLVDIDVVVHDGGLAASWAAEAEIGSAIWVAGPRAPMSVPPEFGAHVLLGDETALPAIARWLEELPDHVQATVAIEVTDAEDEQELDVRAGSTLEWLHRKGAAPGTTDLLPEFARQLRLRSDTWTYVWAHAEARCVKPVRRWARGEGLGRWQSDIGGYWREGVDGSTRA